MAIIIEEEKKTSNLLAIFGWIVIMGIVVVAAYYIFFVSPETATIIPAGNLTNIAPITQSNLSAQAGVTTGYLQGLQSYVQPPSSSGPAAVGRPNPFVAP